MRQKEKQQSIIAPILTFVIFFGYFGWFMAEWDNKQLRKEIVTIKYKALSEVTVGDIHAYSNN